nr:xylulose kinase-1 [Tanacetum cinerariifolium]
MVAYLSKSDASEGFNQIIDFLNGSSIKYALTVNPNIYVSCIKQFWTTVVVKQVNDVTRLQVIVDKKKVVVTEAAIREVLHLDDAEGVDCLPNKEFFIELARMGYEKPSTNSRFIKPSSQASGSDLSPHNTKYASPALTQKVFKNIRRVGKGFSGVHTPLFEGMLVEQEIEEEGDADEHVDEVTAGDDVHGDASAAHGEVPTVTQEPSVPSPTPPTPPPQPSQDLPLTSQVQPTPPQSPQERMIAEMDKDDYVVLMNDKKVEEAKVDKTAQVQGRQAESQDEIYKLDMDHANKVLSMQDDETEPAEVQEVVDAVTTTKLITKVVIAASETVTAASAIISTAEPQVPAATLTATLDPAVKRYQAMKRKTQTEAQARKNMMMYLKNVTGFKLDYFKGMSYDDIRLIFEAKFNSNVDFLLKIKEHMEEEENRALQTINETPIEKAAKRRKLNEDVEDLKRHLQIVPNEDDDVYTEATPLARKVPVVDYEIIELNNKPYYKILRADGTHQLYISFLTLLRNFYREDLDALWNLVKERSSTSKPKNFFDDFLLTTLGAMFEKQDAHAQIWKNQRTVHGQAKVKS